MNLPTMEKDQEDYYQQFFEDETSQPLVKKNPTDLITESQESGFINKFGKRIVSNLLILIGGGLLFYTFSLFFYISAIHPGVGGLKNFPFLTPFVGLIVLLLGVGKIKKKSDWLLYIVFPVMGYISSFFLIYSPIELLGTLLFSFLLSLFIFYFIKEFEHPNK